MTTGSIPALRHSDNKAAPACPGGRGYLSAATLMIRQQSPCRGVPPGLEEAPRRDTPTSMLYLSRYVAVSSLGDERDVTTIELGLGRGIVAATLIDGRVVA